MKHSRHGVRRVAAAQLAAACVILAACGSSPPVQFFALEPAVRADAPRRQSSTVVQVARVHVPPALDRQQIVHQGGSGTLTLSDRSRWGAPLDEMARRVLSQDLLRLLPQDCVILPEEPAPAATEKIVVDIVQFAADATGTVQFAASWSLVSAAPGARPHNHYVELSEPADAQDQAAQVRAMSDILGKLAEQIAAAVAAPQS